MKKYAAEFPGTLALVLIGCGAVTIGGFGSSFPLGILPIGLAFGLTVWRWHTASGRSPAPT
jgi:aquaporin Z